MPVLTRPRNTNTTFPAVRQLPPSQPHGCSVPKATDPWDFGFNRLVPLTQAPPFGAGILAIGLFFFIEFFSNVLLAQVTFATLGIAVTLGTAGMMALVLLILFLL